MLLLRLVFFASLFIVFFLSIVNANDIPKISELGFVIDKTNTFFYLFLFNLIRTYVFLQDRKNRINFLYFYVWPFY